MFKLVISFLFFCCKSDWFQFQIHYAAKTFLMCSPVLQENLYLFKDGWWEKWIGQGVYEAH